MSQDLPLRERAALSTKSHSLKAGKLFCFRQSDAFLRQIRSFGNGTVFEVPFGCQIFLEGKKGTEFPLESVVESAMFWGLFCMLIVCCCVNSFDRSWRAWIILDVRNRPWDPFKNVFSRLCDHCVRKQDNESQTQCFAVCGCATHSSRGTFVEGVRSCPERNRKGWDQRSFLVFLTNHTRNKHTNTVAPFGKTACTGRSPLVYQLAGSGYLKAEWSSLPGKYGTMWSAHVARPAGQLLPTCTFSVWRAGLHRSLWCSHSVKHSVIVDYQHLPTCAFLFTQDLIDTVILLQKEMTAEQDHFNMLSQQVGQLTQGSPEYDEVAEEIVASQSRLAMLMGRNMKCFTQVSILLITHQTCGDRNLKIGLICFYHTKSANFHQSCCFWRKSEGQTDNPPPMFCVRKSMATEVGFVVFASCWGDKQQVDRTEVRSSLCVSWMILHVACKVTKRSPPWIKRSRTISVNFFLTVRWMSCCYGMTHSQIHDKQKCSDSTILESVQYLCVGRGVGTFSGH